jgi:predicted lipoprotein with Yx(FWY)xxD motif
MRSSARWIVPATMLALTAAACAPQAAPMAPAKTASTAKGPTLVDSKDMTLYTFDKDQPGKSACNGQCAKNWPPLAATAGARSAPGWSVVTRDDGTSQWAYNGKPLYTWIKDAKPGDVTGDGVANGTWHVAAP